MTLHFSNPGETLDVHVDAVESAFRAAEGCTRRLLGAEGVDVVVVDPEQTIPEWGVGGYTYGPHTIVVALDPSKAIQGHDIERTLIHEFHHTMRWRGPGCGVSLGQMLVSEGMAVLFEEEVFGDTRFFSHANITENEIVAARAVLHEPEFSQRKRFFGNEGVTFALGYTYGYQLCRAFGEANATRTSQLVDTPARDVLEFSV